MLSDEKISINQGIQKASGLMLESNLKYNETNFRIRQKIAWFIQRCQR